jgi:hypothetical protein
MYKCLLLLLLSTCTLTFASAQNTYIPLGSDEYQLLERLETKSGRFSDSLFLSIRPLSRKDAVQFLTGQKAAHYNASHSNADNAGINRAISLSGEYLEPNGDGAEDSDHPLLGTFYTKKTDLIHLSNRHLFLSVNPVLSAGISYETTDGRFAQTIPNTTQGIEMRGNVRDVFGFYFLGTHNYEEPASYVARWRVSNGVFPGADNSTEAGKGYRFFQFRGYGDIALVKDHISLTLGYDRHFLGDGFRSLFLSDFSRGAAYARINTRIWKLQYQNLYLKLLPQTLGDPAATGGNKYATAHYLSMNITHWLNVGIFETVTFTRNGGYELSYLNPVIFYRAIERGMGSPDKVSIGFNLKAIALKRFNIYSQLLINEFTTRELFAGKGYWANKWGIQTGVKYFDAFGLSNLDLQAEVNVVRPYTYQHYVNVDGFGIANYTHGNQALAHPLGAGFAEVNAFARYRPLPRLLLEGRAMYYKQGVDTGFVNNGVNILKDYNGRADNYGIQLINGPEANCLLLNFQASYELRPRLYADLAATWRKYQVAIEGLPQQKSLLFSVGLRLNLSRLDRTFY